MKRPSWELVIRPKIVVGKSCDETTAKLKAPAGRMLFGRF